MNIRFNNFNFNSIPNNKFNNNNKPKVAFGDATAVFNHNSAVIQLCNDTIKDGRLKSDTTGTLRGLLASAKIPEITDQLQKVVDNPEAPDKLRAFLTKVTGIKPTVN
ncbi:MAG TPA: hypothetical protein DDW90_10285 [Cyanobacteria bacterium UBA9971]|nr:hypothetical protein [Cyanobacteria bacterium UBA9971]